MEVHSRSVKRTLEKLSVFFMIIFIEMRFWSMDRFRQMCILSGCDYLDSPPGIGLKKSLSLLERIDAYSLLSRWRKWGNLSKAPKLPEGYEEQFKLADAVFLYQRVYDPSLRRLVTLTPLHQVDPVTSRINFIKYRLYWS